MSTTSVPVRGEHFFAFLDRRLRDRKLDSLVRNFFRPGSGGNRNFTLMDSLGVYLAISDGSRRVWEKCIPFVHVA